MNDASAFAIEPDWPAPDHVRVASTTRLGGVSRPPFDSMNIGFSTGDDADAVRENRRRLSRALELPREPAWLDQVHGNRVVPRTAIDEGAEVEADGTWTTTAGVVIAVLTADCLPVVITDRRGSAIAVVHAGWRGLAAGILENAVTAIDTAARTQAPSNGGALDDPSLLAWLGPAIGPSAFEVGDEVRAAFVDRDADAAGAFTRQPVQGKWLADLYRLAGIALNRGHAVEVYGGDYCTFSDSKRFHSHRRDGRRSGRMATLAWLTAEP